MPARLPVPADFPSQLVLAITPPPTGQQPTNVLILLHGLGDTHTPFTGLAQQLHLPETASISLRAPAPLPDIFDLGREGWHWGDDIVFDNATGGVDLVDVPYTTSVKVILDEVVLGGLVQKCGYGLRDVMVFGFGQGGAVGLSVAREIAMRDAEEKVRGREMGGVVSIGGPLPSAFKRKSNQEGKSKTPVLLLHGSSSSAITTTAVGEVKSAFENLEVHQWKKAGDGMPGNRDEMLPIMRFFARRLRSRAGVPSDAVEIS